MKKLILLFLFSITLNSNAQETELLKITLEGFYSGKNLMIKNPWCMGKGEIGWSINGIKVNGNYTTAEINNEIFELPLDEHKLVLGAPVKLEIWHKKPCSFMNKPMIMNPGALLTSENMLNKTENRIVIEGSYFQNNLLVVNSNNCIKEVKVNGKVVPTNLTKDIAEINLFSLGAIDEKPGFKPGDKITIELICNKNGEPLILNPEYLHYEDK